MTKATLCECGQQKDRRAQQCRACYSREPTSKVCRGCNEEHAIEEFAWRPDGRGGHKRRSRCRSCESATARLRRELHPETVQASKKAWNQKNPEKVRLHSARARWRRMGLDPDEVELLIEAHDGRCDICGVQPDIGKLCVDHDHVSGDLRGLLCSMCNLGLGHFRDNETLLRDAITYLKGRTREDQRE